MPPHELAAILTLFLFVSTSIPVFPADVAKAQTILGSHWVPGWGFRDELNMNDTDNQNFWTDNVGKILTSGIITGDLADANRALWFIQNHMTASYYLPELIVNSSFLQPSVVGESRAVTNRIVLPGANSSRSELQQLSIGDYYAGPWTAGYLGADRIWYNGSAHRALSASVMATPYGFIKRAFFSFNGLSFYTYLNATINVGDPYVRVTVQVQPMNSTFGAGDHGYLQAFANSNPRFLQYSFGNVTLFDANGNPVRLLPSNNAAPQGSGGTVIAYSNQTSIFDQDSVALRFNGSGMQGTEHWHQDGAFDGMSWVGLEYDFPATGRGQLSSPVFSEVYPIRHLDSRLLSDTAKYLVTNPKNVAVSPPASFGFVARGLALASNLDPSNSTLRKLATGYWNFYYGRYQGMLPDRAYARSTAVFALAGFELYRGNVAVENFTREFVGGFGGASIEEHGWAAAALQTLLLYNYSFSNLGLVQDMYGTYIPGADHFLGLAGSTTKVNDTFEFAETASGLLSGGLSYNSSDVLWAMNAVFQSNSSGVLLNRPYHGDLANTETIPAYMLAVWLFTNAMRSRTGGYWIAWVQNANISAIDFANSKLVVHVVGKNGTVAVGSPNGVMVYRGIDGVDVLTLFTPAVPRPSSTPWVLIGVVLAAIAALLLVPGYVVRRKSRASRASVL